MAATFAVPRRVVFLLPVVIFGILAGYFLWGLDPERDVRELPSAMIDKPAPKFDLPPITGMSGPGLSTADLQEGRVVLVNFFASWCAPCRVEHPIFMRLSKEGRVPIFGINYKNKPEEARAWLAELGDPYDRIGADESGRVGIDWGVYGLPETFIVDGEGRIRYRHVGPIMPKDLNETILPILEELEG